MDAENMAIAERKKKGRASTILTGTAGDTSEAPVLKPKVSGATLLGA
jgi:hypothetical protein